MYGLCITCGEDEKNAYNSSADDFEGMEPLGRPKRKWQDANKTRPKEVGRENLDQITCLWFVSSG